MLLISEKMWKEKQHFIYLLSLIFIALHFVFFIILEGSLSWRPNLRMMTHPVHGLHQHHHQTVTVNLNQTWQPEIAPSQFVVTSWTHMKTIWERLLAPPSMRVTVSPRQRVKHPGKKSIWSLHPYIIKWIYAVKTYYEVCDSLVTVSLTIHILTW